MSSGTTDRPDAANPFDQLAQRDPTGEVDLESPAAVETAIRAILDPLYGEACRGELLALAVSELVAAFRGDYPGLLRCDTLYHDLRHALESGLTMARLLDGHARSLAPGSAEAIDGDHAMLGVLLALFHDVGMLRRDGEGHLWGAVLTPIHEERGVEFMRRYLARTPLAPLTDKAELIMATKLAFTMPAAWPAPDRLLASLVASADLLSQLADRCYLEKCRDFLFLEFSAIGLAGTSDTPYPDRETLLAKTPDFYSGLIRGRLDEEFGGVHRLMWTHFGGVNPYDAAIQRNLSYLTAVLAAQDFTRLRRRPQPFIDVAEE
ncbi:MAG: hypothetical protein A2045_15795 [Rhodocyclales bacterium GWA2_65_20]|nr:MAG: hypothetical protein A2045_15795 [Rhodocyclales bacterium GWA2_65_20]